MRKSYLWSVLIVACLLASCATVDLRLKNMTQPVTMSAEIDVEVATVKHFEKTVRVWFTLYDLVTLNQPDIDKILEKELRDANGDAIVNLKIKGQDTAIDRIIPIAISTAAITLSTIAVYDAHESYTSDFGESASQFDLRNINVGLSLAGSVLSLLASQISSRTYTIEGDIVRIKQ